MRRIADWAADSGDAGTMDFIVLDKRRAHVYVFAPEGRLRAHTPVLLGAAPGDDSVEGIGQKPLHEVRPEERTTPAGRFVGQSGLNAHGEDVFWVDYQAAVSMHRVRELEPSERRLHRLATPTVEDNRISYGCINMPVEFFETVMLPTFKGRRAMVYVLPEERSFAEVFPMAYDVTARHAAARGRPPM
ncbi:L,D-transpeptidase [Piscinibacter sakaiensis]|uniref:L,D-transpeptidase n=1 Tax=Piscinibacter sakaiensis TaxID=1547922 RepID=UPI0037283DB9